jgi:hypothetical protein
MAGLLSTFHAMPTVVRRRAGELLDVIRDAVTRGLTKLAPSAPTLSPAPEPEELSATITEDTMAIDEPPTSPELTQLTSIWSSLPPQTVAAPSSSLFPTAVALVAASSVLFGATLASSPAQVRAGRLQEIADRVHSSLAVIPRAPPSALSPVADDLEPTPTDPTLLIGATAEIAYVPAAQRQAKSEVEDTIVVVGQAKKKRKRTKTNEGEKDKGKEKRSSSMEADEEVVPFNYANAPNILDDEPEQRAEAPRKKKKPKKAKGMCLCGVGFGDELMVCRYGAGRLPLSAKRQDAGEERECVAYVPMRAHSVVFACRSAGGGLYSYWLLCHLGETFLLKTLSSMGLTSRMLTYERDLYGNGIQLLFSYPGVKTTSRLWWLH